MVTLESAVKAVLEGDATLTAILTGRIYDASELNREIAGL